MKINIKKLSVKGVIPTYSNEDDACLDITATRIISDSNDYLWFGTDIAIEIPEGYVGLIFPRSSVSKTDLELANSVGVIDCGYKGEVQIRFNYRNTYMKGKKSDYIVGNRIAQIMIIPRPKIEFVEVDKLGGDNRGGGFGSTNENETKTV